MTPPSPEAESLESRTRELLTDLLMNVPIMRAEGTPEDYLASLESAYLFYPVFQTGDSPVDAWLVEGERVARELNRPDALGLVKLRRAIVSMRRLDYEAALAELDNAQAELAQLTASHRVLHAVTRARVLVRQRHCDAARRVLADSETKPDDWTAPLTAVAQGELRLEEGDIRGAQQAFEYANRVLPVEFVEERIAVLQALGFVATAQVNAPAALAYLDAARQVLRGAGAWSEVIQMNVAVGSLLTAAGDQGTAEQLFQEALALCKAHPQPEMETLLQLGLVRTRSAAGRVDDAVAAATEVAKASARQGSVLGYSSMLVLIANLWSSTKNYEEAYRTLATGIAVAKKRGWVVVEKVLRAQVDRLRNQVLGPQRFDAMVQAMIDERKGKN